VDLLHAAADDEVAAADDVPVAAGADELAPEELLEFELPQAAISTAARAGNRTVERRCARSKAHNLHPGWRRFARQALHSTIRRPSPAHHSADSAPAQRLSLRSGW
jgi:hypothetical protein